MSSNKLIVTFTFCFRISLVYGTPCSMLHTCTKCEVHTVKLHPFIVRLHHISCLSIMQPCHLCIATKRTSWNISTKFKLSKFSHSRVKSHSVFELGLTSWPWSFDIKQHCQLYMPQGEFLWNFSTIFCSWVISPNCRDGEVCCASSLYMAFNVSNIFTKFEDHMATY